VRPRRETAIAADAGERGRIRRFEPFPWWGWMMLALTAVVVPLAWRFSVGDVIAADGTNCGSALFGGGVEGDILPIGQCTQAVSDAQPAAVLFGVVAIVLILASVTTVTVRGFLPREAHTPD
jgi:uncharacterized membrane protein YhaH (DUF805 family)